MKLQRRYVWKHHSPSTATGVLAAGVLLLFLVWLHCQLAMPSVRMEASGEGFYMNYHADMVNVRIDTRR